MLALIGTKINGHTKISYLHTLKGGNMETPETVAMKAMSRLLRESAERVEKESHGLRSIATQLSLQADVSEHTGAKPCSEWVPGTRCAKEGRCGSKSCIIEREE